MSERELPDPGEGVGECFECGGPISPEDGCQPCGLPPLAMSYLTDDAPAPIDLIGLAGGSYGKDNPDLVNAPPHYRQGGIECIDAIQAALTPEEFRGYLKGNSMKYLWREKHKGGDEDLKKAAWYLHRIEEVKTKESAK